MATTVIGFDGDVDEVGWSQLLAMASGQDDYVIGFPVGAGPGVREVRVFTGVALVGGVYVYNTTTSVTLPAKSGSGIRHDLVVLEVDWTTNTATIKAKVGTSATMPALTQTLGVKWEVPLASVYTTSAKTGVYAASDFESRRPLRKVPRAFALTGWPIQAYGSGIAGQPLASVQVPDPGWPYRLLVTSAQIHVAASNGQVSLDIDADGDYFARGLSDWFQANEENVQQVNAGGLSPIYTGPKLVRARITAIGVTAGQVSVQNPNYSYCTLLQIPTTGAS